MALCSVGRPLLQNSRHALGWFFKQKQTFCCKANDPQEEEEIRKKLRLFPGGSIDLQKRESGIAVMTVNNPARMNAFSGE